MTASIRILTASSLDSNPSLLIVSPGGSKTLINCGEGCQRSFLESASSVGGRGSGSGGGCTAGTLRVSSVNRICLTHIGHDALGGLPGMILTTADVAENAAKNFRSASRQNSMNSEIGYVRGENQNDKMRRVDGNIQNHQQRNQQYNDESRNGNHNRKRKESSLLYNDSNNNEDLPGLEIVGPKGTRAFLHSLRHFMRRDRFQVRAHEGTFDSASTSGNSNNNSNNGNQNTISTGKKSKKQKKKSKENFNEEVVFHVKSIPISYEEHFTNLNENNQPRNNNSNGSETDDEEMIMLGPSSANGSALPASDTSPNTKQAVSYLFSTTPIPGKFLIEKARALKIPPGPLYAELKAGKNVTFLDPTTNEERTVTSEEVVAKGSPGVGVAVLYCPNLRVLDLLKMEDAFRELQVASDLVQNNDAAKERNRNDSNTKKSIDSTDAVELDAIVHITPKSIFQHPSYQSWCKQFGNSVDHIVLHAAENIDVRVEGRDVSPFGSAIRGGIRRSFVHDGVFPRPVLDPVETMEEVKDEGEREVGAKNQGNGLNVISGCPMMEYLLIPRSRKGLNVSSVRPLYSANEVDTLKEDVDKMGAADLAGKIISSFNWKNLNKRAELEKESVKTSDEGIVKNKRENLGELIFTGTGSAIPCKHRNVTGMYIRMDNGNSMLLDVGEGTVGQLLQSWKCCRDGHTSNLQRTGITHPSKQIKEYQSRLKGIKAVWVSHPHADHHLGLLRLLSERSSLCGTNDPIVLMAPPTLFSFLSEYAAIVPEVRRSYIAVDCRDMLHGKDNPMGRKLFNDLGVTSCISIPVAHCPHSFAVVVDDTSFGKVAYSGDCRPSNRFANVGYDADLLIHEATFEDGMEEEAVLKRHSTVGEALEIGRMMNAKSVVLTHFSQRYPKIPPLKIRSDSGTESGNGADVSLNDKESIDSSGDMPVVFAFDFMKLSPNTVSLAAQLTPALRRLYPGENDHMDVDEISSEENPMSAKELMGVPGVFAAKGIL